MSFKEQILASSSIRLPPPPHVVPVWECGLRLLLKVILVHKCIKMIFLKILTIIFYISTSKSSKNT